MTCSHCRKDYRGMLCLTIQRSMLCIHSKSLYDRMSISCSIVCFHFVSTTGLHWLHATTPGNLRKKPLYTLALPHYCVLVNGKLQRIFASYLFAAELCDSFCVHDAVILIRILPYTIHLCQFFLTFLDLARA